MISSRGPAVRLAVLGVGLVPPVLMLAWSLAPAGLPFTVLIYGTGLALAVRGMSAAYPHDRDGLANVVTLVRLGFVGALSAALSGAVMPGWAVFGIALAALSLDGVDGFFARRQQLVSAFGARFDMEVDVALAAILSLALLFAGQAGIELVVLGGARYAFVAAAVALPWLNVPLAPSLWRKTVCVIQIGTLVVLSAPLLPEAACRPLAILAALAVLWSFGRDIRTLAARRLP